jgi:hypothetical protein
LRPDGHGKFISCHLTSFNSMREALLPLAQIVYGDFPISSR